MTKLRVFPTTKLQQPPSVLALVGLLYQLLQISISVEQKIRDRGLDGHDVVVVEAGVHVRVGQRRLTFMRGSREAGDVTASDQG